jgi:hypothetical protein
LRDSHRYGKQEEAKKHFVGQHNHHHEGVRQD